jgi:5-formyltetrahydrofolate cyclo-ligase
MAPTYFRREPGIEFSNGHRGSALAKCFLDQALPWRGNRAGDIYSQCANDPMTAPVSIEAAKTKLRREALARRESIPADQRAAAAQAMAEHAPAIALGTGIVVSGYSPLKSEINPLPLLRRCADAGAALALPVVAGRGQPLTMRAWDFGQVLGSGVWGIREPTPDAPEVDPDILFVPLLAFDSRGHRIGYGAGYYDMTIARLRAQKKIIAIGVAFAAQEIAEVPTTPRDARLDLVLTERGMIDYCKG